MDIVQAKKVPAAKRFWIIIRNGMFLQGLRNRMAKVGIDIMPYYWVQEEIMPCQAPSIKGNAAEYQLRYLNSDELKVISKGMPNINSEQLVKDLNGGQLCLGLECKGEIAAFMFIELNNFYFNNKKFEIKENEAYLLNMWTFNKFRGKNLAPYLRYQSYQLLREMGKVNKYSVTQYFNKSSIKFKRKLNSKPLKLYLYISFFGRVNKNFLIKNYRN